MSKTKTKIQKVTPSQKKSVNFQDSCLVIIAGQNLGKMIHIGKEPILLGRSKECGITCNDPLASRIHAEIFWKGSRIAARDLNSTNGTYVNFNPISEAVLNNGDKISVGETILKFLTQDSIEKEFHDEIYKLAILDGLTQIYNRKHLEIVSAQEFSRALRYDHPLSVCICDIDHFKQINDKFGHQSGDYILREVSKLLLSNVRETDIVGRYGGEEFFIIYTEENENNATLSAERIRTAIETYKFISDEGEISVTMSFGIGYLCEGIESVEDLIRLADENLYKAKEGGRNQVVGYME